MRLFIYSDLHLEFGKDFVLPAHTKDDLLILAGDIVTLEDSRPLEKMLSTWQGYVMYVPGNHEYYSKKSCMKKLNRGLLHWQELHNKCKDSLAILMNESLSVSRDFWCLNPYAEDVEFFGGTMWTDYDGKDPEAMRYAQYNLNDHWHIKTGNGYKVFSPEDAYILHQIFKRRLIKWLQQPIIGPRVVITHHAPVINPNTKFKNSPLQAAFNSLDMVPIIEKYQPDLWIYGHTHECDDHYIGKTRIISNQRGYPGEEVSGFDPLGKMVEI